MHSPTAAGCARGPAHGAPRSPRGVTGPVMATADVCFAAMTTVTCVHTQSRRTHPTLGRRSMPASRWGTGARTGAVSEFGACAHRPRISRSPSPTSQTTPSAQAPGPSRRSRTQPQCRSGESPAPGSALRPASRHPTPRPQDPPHREAPLTEPARCQRPQPRHAHPAPSAWPRGTGYPPRTPRDRSAPRKLLPREWAGAPQASHSRRCVP